MKQKFLKTMLLLCALVVGFGNAWGDTYEQLTSIANIDESAEYVLGVDGTGFHYDGTSSWGKTALPSAQTPYKYKLKVADDGKSFTAQTTISSTTYYLQIPTSNTFSMATSTGTNTDIIIGTTQISETNYAVANKSTTARHLRINGSSGLRSYASTTGTMAFFYKVISFTISAESNNISWGTVAISGNKITATPASGYRVNTSTPYSVTSGTATVTDNGDNTFTVTPTSNCTVQINFEAIPTHTITCVADPVGAGTFDAVSSLYEGGTTDIKATANSGYKFKNWSVSGTGASISNITDNPTTLTMGTANVTLTANFDAVTTYEINWSVNGIIVKTENVEENADLDFSAPVSGVPTGYAFRGWRTSPLSLTDTDPKDYVTSGKSTENITYYAAIAVETLGIGTWTLDYSEENEAGKTVADVISAKYGESKDYTAADGGAWVIKAYKNTGMQINTGKDCSIKVPSCSGNIQSIAITCSTAKAVGFSASNYSGSGTITYLAYGTDATSQTIDLSNENAKDGYIVPKAGSTSITKIIVTYYKPTYSGYCSTTITVPVTVSSVGYATYASNVPLDFSGKAINAYIAKTKGDGTGVTFEQVYKVPANTGLLLYKSGGTTENIPIYDGATDGTDGNKFVKGTDSKVLFDDGTNYNYILNNVGGTLGFYKANNKKVASNRAYISILKSESAAVKGFIALPGSEETAVEAVKAEAEDGVIFNLAGQRVSKLQRGINIINGKKVVVK